MAIAFVQGKSNNASGSSTTITVTTTSNVTAGSLLVVSVGWGTTDLLPTLADGLGNTYTNIDKLWNATNSQGHATYYAKNIAGGACTITVTFSSSVPWRMVIADEYSGADTSAPLDVHAILMNNLPGKGTDAVTSGTVTTSTNNQLIYGSTQNISGSGTCVAGTGFTSRETIAGVISVSEDKILATAGNTAATFTIGTNSRMLTAVATFKEAAGGGTSHEGAAAVTSAITAVAVAAALLVGAGAVAAAITASSAGALSLPGGAAVTVSHSAATTSAVARPGSAAAQVAFTASSAATIQARGAATASATITATADGTIVGQQLGAASVSIAIVAAASANLALNPNTVAPVVSTVLVGASGIQVVRTMTPEFSAVSVDASGQVLVWTSTPEFVAYEIAG